MNLIRDTFFLTKIQVISENKSQGTMKIRGLFGKAESKNQNNRVYPKHLMEREINRLQPTVKARRLLGELDHPATEVVRLSNASHIITNLKMEGNNVIGECELLNTPAGLTAQALVRGGVQLGISSRGLGTLKESNEGHSTVNEDYRMITYDLVADPSFQEALPAMCESRQLGIKNSKLKLAEERKTILQLKRVINEAFGESLSEGSFGDKTLERKYKQSVKKDIAQIRDHDSPESKERRKRTSRGWIKDVQKRRSLAAKIVKTPPPEGPSREGAKDIISFTKRAAPKPKRSGKRGPGDVFKESFNILEWILEGFETGGNKAATIAKTLSFTDKEDEPSPKNAKRKKSILKRLAKRHGSVSNDDMKRGKAFSRTKK